MTTTDFLAIGATFAGLAMAFSPVLQIRRMRRTRSSRDVSLQYLGMLTLGFLLWIAYGVAIPNWVIVGTNAASLSVMVVTILVALRYRRAGSGRAATGLPVTGVPASPPADAAREGAEAS